jgi:predicted NBD/HSP70 family sugar kinase
VLTKKRLYQINSSRILQYIRLNRGTSRIRAASELDLDRSTLTKVVRFLVNRGLVRECGKYRGKPGVGRMAIGLELDPGFGLVLGVEVQTEAFRWVLVDLFGTPVASGRRDIGGAGLSLETEIPALFREVSEDSARRDGRPIIGLGVGLSGIVDPYRGTVIYSYPLGIAEPINLRDSVERAVGVPVFVENDANCCCWSEMAFRPTPEGRNFIALLGEFRNVDIAQNRVSGFAFGIGIAIRESVLHGDNFTAGEFRSLRYDHDNPSHSQFSISDEESARLPGDRDVLLKLFGEIAYNLSLLVNTLDITKIVLSGDFARFREDLTPILEREIKRNWLYQKPRHCSIEHSPDGENAVPMGAAGLFVQKLFGVPGMTDHVDEDVGFILLERMLPDEATADT